MDFDEWINHPYAKVMIKSIETDYVPRSDFERSVNRSVERMNQEAENLIWSWSFSGSRTAYAYVHAADILMEETG